jgi:uncharacterized membrane protein YqjE
MSESSLTLKEIITNIIQASIKIITGLMHLARLETHLARKSFIIIIVLIFCLGSLLTSTWLSLLVVLFIWLVSMHWSWLFSALIILFLNVVIFTSFLLSILKIKENLLFHATRRQLHNVMGNYEKHKKIETRN